MFNHITHLDNELTELRKLMNERFEKVEQRFEKVEKKIATWLGIGFGFLTILITVLAFVK